MDVKKYMGYLPLCMLSIIIVFSLLVYSKRNDFAIGLSTVAAQEHKSVGDPNAIRDLKYSFISWTIIRQTGAYMHWKTYGAWMRLGIHLQPPMTLLAIWHI